ncbi:integrase [Prauserella flavalba]|uniref:integrase n=1 Tax=Prauserella flavalba TaxID=1477506 RepID=UPI0036F00E24
MTHAFAEYTPPTAGTPLINPSTLPVWRRPFIPCYGDTNWSFHYLSDNPSASNDLIRWDRFPEIYREPLRHAAWALVNFPLPDADLAMHGPAMRSRLSVGRMYRTVRDWLGLAEWLRDNNITVLSEVTVDDLSEFSLHLGKRGLSRNTVVNYLVGLGRLHCYTRDYLPPQHRLVEPPWIGDAIDEYLPAASPRGENITEPITPDTLGPLLIWALRMVEDFADDILGAHVERQRLLDAAREATEAQAGRENLLVLLHQLRREGKPIPTSRRTSVPSSSAGLFLSGITGTSVHKVRLTLKSPEWRSYVQANAGPSRLETPIQGRVDGKPWHDGIEFDEVPVLVRRLVDSCFIVIAYLTGMRPGEVLGLQHGCCPDPNSDSEAPEGAVRHVINGRQFKHARDENGNHDSAGSIRDTPWIAIPPVVRAIRVLERLVSPGRLLFDAVAHDPRNRPQRDGKSMANCTIANRIERTVEWFNELAGQLDRDHEQIPPDPAGRIGTARFRRSLAWHIARRPGGLVALAVQYGHLRTIISEGYASRSRGGIHSLLDFETARSVAEHLSDVHDALQEGEGVSGPAARRLVNSAAQQHHRFGGMITTMRQARALLADPTLNVFDNPDAYLTCNYDPAKALCHPGRGGKSDTPSLDRCVSTCANIARTDTHANHLEKAAESLRDQATTTFVPEPIADRLQAKAAEFVELAQRHRRDRITFEENDQ